MPAGIEVHVSPQGRCGWLNDGSADGYARAHGHRSRDFGLFWSWGTISGVGSSISMLAFPTIAVLGPHAGPVAVGATAALGSLPLFFLSMVGSPGSSAFNVA